MDQTAMLKRLDILIQDQDNFSFDPTVKQEAYQTVVNNDPFVFIPDIDKTLTTSSTNNIYALDDSIEDVFDVKIDQNKNGFPRSIGTNYWEYINGNLIFKWQMLGFTAALPIWVYVRRKLSNADIIPGYLQAYVLEMTGAKLLDYNIKNKVFRFLHNDTTLAELQMAKREALSNATSLREKMPNRVVVRM